MPAGRRPHPQFLPAKAKVTIGSLDDEDLDVEAQYNPRELVVTQPISWTEHKAVGNQKADALHIEFTGMQPRTVQVELLFDGAECGGGTVMSLLAGKIQTLASVRDPYSSIEELRRPHVCVIRWGRDLPRFVCVIDSVVVKYQMWDRDGAVLRATATVSLKEARAIHE